MNGQDSLQLFDFGVLLQALSNNLKVGVLAVRSGRREKYLRLDRAKLQCVYAKRPKVSLSKVLYNHRACEKAHIKKAMDELGGTPNETDLAAFLLDAGFVSEKQLRRAQTYQMVEEMLELFYWKNVGFEFYAGSKPALLDELPERGIQSIGQPCDVDNLLFNCTKITDDIEKFKQATPSLRDVYDLQIKSLDELERVVPDVAQRELVLLIDGVRDMREVLQDMRMNRFEVLQFFYRFKTSGRIRAKNSFELLMLAENRRGEFSPEKRARLLERVQSLGVDGFDVLLPLAETYEELGRNARAARCFVKHARRCFKDGDQDGALDSAHRAVSLARKDVETRKFQIALLRRLGLDEDAGAAQMQLAAVHHANGDLPAARKALELATWLAPGDAGILQRLAEVLEEMGETKEAALRMREAARLLAGKGDHFRAAELYQRTIALFPLSTSARFELADSLHADGRDDEAVQELANVTDLVGQEMGDLPAEERMEMLERVERGFRDYGGLLSSAAGQLGRAYVSLGKTERALRVLRDAGQELVGAKRHRSAVEVLSDLVELAPNELDGRRRLARAHQALGDNNRAIQQFRRMANQLVAKERWAEALEVFREMLDVDPACLDAHRGVAKALLEMGENERASEHYHRMGLLHRGCGRAHEALPYLREAVQKRPNDPALLDEYSELLLAVGADDSETLSALSALVELRMARDQYDLAAIALTRILDIDNRYPGARDILHEAANQLVIRAESTREIRTKSVKSIMEQARAIRGKRDDS